MGEPTIRTPRPDSRSHVASLVETALEGERAQLAELNVTGRWQEAADRSAHLEQRVTPEVVKLLLEAALSNRMLGGGHYNTAERLLKAAWELVDGRDLELEALTVVGLVDLYRSAAKKNQEFHPKLDRDKKLQEARWLEAQAKSALKKVTAVSVAHVKASCEFGLLDVEENKLDDALVDYQAATVAAEKLLAAQPDNVIVRSQLCRTYTLTGEAHEKLGNADAAFTHHERAFQGYEVIADKRGMALGQQGMALALEKKGDLAGAIVCWQAVERIANSGQEVDTYMADKAAQALARLASDRTKA